MRAGSKLLAPPVIIPGIVILLVLAAILAPAQSLAEYGCIGVLVLLLAALTSIIIHEAGHVLAGWLVRFRFALWIAGPLRIQPETHLRPNWDWRQMGLVISVPPVARSVRLRQMGFMAGGPVLNLIAGQVALFIQRQIGEPPPTWIYEAGECSPSRLALILFFYFLGWMSSLFGLINIWPRPLSTIQTDGAWLAALIQNRASAALVEKSIRMEAEYKTR